LGIVVDEDFKTAVLEKYTPDQKIGSISLDGELFVWEFTWQIAVVGG